MANIAQNFSIPSSFKIATSEKTVSFSEFDQLAQSAGSYLSQFENCFFYTPSCSIESLAIILGALQSSVPLCLIPPTLPSKTLEKLKKQFPQKVDTLTASSKTWSYRQTDKKSTSPSSTALYMLTSGTTSIPKIVPLTQSNLINATKNAIPRLQLTQESSYLLSLPLYHMSGIGAFLRTLFSGATLVLPSNRKEPFSYTLPFTHCSCIPYQLEQLINHPLNTKNMIAILIGGAPLPQWLFEKSRHLPLILSYGMTETTGTHLMTTIGSLPLFPNQMGWPIEENTCNVNPQGILEVKGRNCFEGYLNKDHNQEWFSTQDIVSFDKERGYLFKNRADRMVIYKGENIYPEEIESIALKFPGIMYSKLQKSSSEEKLILTISANAQIKIDELKKLLSLHLPKNKRPDAIGVLHSSNLKLNL